MHIDCRHQLRIHRAEQHHACNFHRFGIGYSQAITKLGFLAKTLHECADLWSTTMHDHRLNADRVHERNVLGERTCSIGVARSGKRVASVLHDNRLASKLLDIRQRFNQQRANTLVRFVHQFAHGYIPTIDSPSSSFRPSATFAA